MPDRGSYEALTCYTNGDIVRHSGRLWKCLMPTGAPPSFAESAWQHISIISKAATEQDVQLGIAMHEAQHEFQTAIAGIVADTEKLTAATAGSTQATQALTAALEKSKNMLDETVTSADAVPSILARQPGRASGMLADAAMAALVSFLHPPLTDADQDLLRPVRDRSGSITFLRIDTNQFLVAPDTPFLQVFERLGWLEGGTLVSLGSGAVVEFWGAGSVIPPSHLPNPESLTARPAVYHRVQVLELDE